MAAADDETLWITLTGISGLDRGTSFTGTGLENYRLSRRQWHHARKIIGQRGGGRRASPKAQRAGGARCRLD
jgi:hypothetical protein